MRNVHNIIRMKRLVAAGSLFSMLLTAAPAFAAELPVDFATRCEVRQDKLAERQATHEANHADRESRYADHVARLNTLVADAEAAGLDASAVEADIATFDALHNEFLASRGALAAHVTEMVAFDCASEDMESALAMREEGRALHQATKADADALRAFLRDTLRPDVKALRSQLLPSVTLE